MKKVIPILRIISFILILILLIYTLSYIGKPFNWDNVRIAGMYAEKNNSLDIVYIGGSAAFVYYAPIQSWEKKGFVAYDYAANTIEAELYKPLIKEMLKTQSPKVIIIDARAFQYRDKDGIDAQPPWEVPYRNILTGMRLSKNKIEFITHNVGKYISDKKLSYFFDIIKYHDLIIKNMEEKIPSLRMMLGQYKSPHNGFQFIHSVKEIPRYSFMTDKKKQVSSDTESILIDLLDYLDSAKLNCLFVVSPYAEKMEHKAIFNYVQEIIENRGYRFLDANEYTDDMNLDFSCDFYNETHVNIYGAEKYTDFLNDYLERNYAIPNHKNEPEYSYMDEYLPAWHSDVNAAKSAISQMRRERGKNEK